MKSLLVLVFFLGGCSQIGTRNQNNSSVSICGKDQLARLISDVNLNLDIDLQDFMKKYDSIEWSVLDQWMVNVGSKGRKFDKIYQGKCENGGKIHVFYAGVLLVETKERVVFVSLPQRKSDILQSL